MISFKQAIAYLKSVGLLNDSNETDGWITEKDKKENGNIITTEHQFNDNGNYNKTVRVRNKKEINLKK